MVAFPNPDPLEIHFAQMEDGPQIGDIWEAARAAGVKPGTLRVWMTRDKIEPIIRGEAGDLFHIPTVVAASKAPPGRRSRAAA